MIISNDYQPLIANLARAYSTPTIKADLRTLSSDFQVMEILGFEPSGEGEHLFLQIEKIDTNTEWVTRQLQKIFGLTSKDIGYAGKKDRYSVSTQWFSLHLPGRQVDLAEINDDGFKVIQAIRHNKKLRMGSLKENQFVITLRNMTAEIDQTLINIISESGVPNYFGSQRFGFEAGNLVKAEELLNQRIKIKNRNKRGLVISSARSLLFNLLLSNRVKENSWIMPVKGDCLMLDGTQSFFMVDELSERDQQRIKDGDLHISGLLVGKQTSDASFEAKQKEQDVLQTYPQWINGLERLALTTGRRAYRCIPKKLSVEQNDDVAVVRFSLSKGCYATSVIREMVNVEDKAIRK